jgi:hypothetical protein
MKYGMTNLPSTGDGINGPLKYFLGYCQEIELYRSGKALMPL